MFFIKWYLGNWFASWESTKLDSSYQTQNSNLGRLRIKYEEQNFKSTCSNVEESLSNFDIGADFLRPRVFRPRYF
jgi:hypothetical protein